MDITVKISLTDAQKRGIDAQLRRLKGLTSVIETPEQFVSRIVQKTLGNWEREASREFITNNQEIFNRTLDALALNPRAAELLAQFNLRLNDGGLMVPIEPALSTAQAGLQVGHGQPIGVPLLQELRAFGYTIIRIDVQNQDQDRTTMMAQEVLIAGMQPLCIINRPEQMHVLPDGALVELGNEPDLGWPIESYLPMAEQCVAIALSGRGQRLYIGAVSNLNARGFHFLSQIPWEKYPKEICCSIHRYPDGSSPENPHKGWTSREHEVATLKRIVGERPLACSEIGYYDGPNGWTEQQVAENFVWERDFFSKQGFEIISAYNINDGPGPEPIDHFGFRRLDGTWKPVASAFAKGSV
jgi:hypothetical protein